MQKQNIDQPEWRELQFENTGIHIDEEDKFLDAYHADSYKVASQKLREIIDDFRRSDQEYNEANNILSFIGERGTGKSSVMRSFIRALEKIGMYHHIPKPLGTYFNEKEVSFTCLDYIDAALLEKGEDIISLVLAQIYQKFLDMDQIKGLFVQGEYDYRKRELLKQIESVYRTVCEIQILNSVNNLQNSASQSYLSKIDSLASSQKVKKEFGKLVQDFIELMKTYENSRREIGVYHYLVITIDDIDLNVDNGFSMLEKIHRYLLVKNVIVVLAVDYQQMQRLAIRHFYQMFPKVDAVLQDGKYCARKIATDYLDKVIPLNHRVYISDINNIYINGRTQILNEKAGVKESLLRKIYNRTGVAFDTQGLKQHFYQSGALRKINNFYLFLDNMSKVNIHDIYMNSEKSLSDDGIWNIIDENWNLMLQDLMNRIVVDKLSLYPEITTSVDGSFGYTRNVRTFLEDLGKQDLRRAKNEVVLFYKNLLPSELQIEDIEEEYSYGDLVEAMYGLGRINNNQYKPLVHCLLAYFSYMFTREYFLQVKKNPDHPNRIKELIGRSVAERWADRFLPSVLISLDKTSGIEEEREIDEQDNIALGRIMNVWLVRAMSVVLPANIFETKSEMAEIVRGIEVLYLLFTDIKSGNGLDINLDSLINFKLQRIKSGRIRISLLLNQKEDPEKQLGNVTGTFNILNFMVNTQDVSERLKKLEEKLRQALDPNQIREFDISMKDLIEINNWYTDNSLSDAYKQWENKYGRDEMPFPLYWFDMSYNILKRTRRFAKKTIRKYILKHELESVFDEMQLIYKNISQQLEQQCTMLGGSAEVPYDFAKKFKENPIVQYFMEEDLKEYQNDEKIESLLKNKRRKVWGQFFQGLILSGEL